MSYSLQSHGLQPARLPCPSPAPRIYSNSHPSSRWCHPTISSSAFNLSQHQGLLQWRHSSHQVVKGLELQLQPSVLPMNIQDWFPLGWTCCISLLSKGLWSVFSNTTVQKPKWWLIIASFSPKQNFGRLSHGDMNPWMTDPTDKVKLILSGCCCSLLESWVQNRHHLYLHGHLLVDSYHVIFLTRYVLIPCGPPDIHKFRSRYPYHLPSCSVLDSRT